MLQGQAAHSGQFPKSYKNINILKDFILGKDQLTVTIENLKKQSYS
jgi:hypothetical protein